MTKVTESYCAACGISFSDSEGHNCAGYQAGVRAFTCTRCAIGCNTVDHRGWCNFCLAAEAQPIAAVEYHMTDTEFRIVLPHGKTIRVDEAKAYLAVWASACLARVQK